MAKDLNVFDKEYGLLINGVWTKPGALLDSYNPANGSVQNMAQNHHHRTRCHPQQNRRCD